MYKKRSLSLRLRADWQLYVFLLVPVIYIVIFAYVPMVGLQIAFKNFSPRKGIWSSDWVGLEYFARFFTSHNFIRTLGNTLTLSLYSIVMGFPIPVVMALMLNCVRRKTYRNFAQTVSTLPHFISTVVLVGIMFQLFSARNGLYGNAYYALSGGYPADPYASPANFRHFYVWSGVWQEFGWGSIIYLATLSAVDPELHEAAMIDGASRLKRVFHIDFPVILPTVVIMLILRAGSVMSVGFEKVFLMQNGVNLTYSEVISTYVYKVGLASGGATDFSYATAIGFFNSVVNMVLLLSVNAVADRIGETSLW